MPIQPADFDLYALLSKVRAMLGTAARKKGLRLGLHVTPRTPQWIHGDQKHLEQVLINLVGNAVKFTEKGHVLISVDAVSEEESLSRIRFEVSDTGIGIAPEARGRIFDSFTQADETIVNRFGGTGLGLAISKQLVELQGGDMGVDSEVGSGSTFWFELGLERRAPADSARDPLAKAAAVTLGLSEETLAAVRLALAGLKIQAVVAKSAGEAREHVARARSEGKRRPVILVDQSLADQARSVMEEMSADLSGPSFVLLRNAGPARALSQEERVRFVSALVLPAEEAAVAAALRIAIAGECGERTSIRELAAAGHSRSLSILIADDNGTNQKVIAKILERGGHRPQVVDNGEAAVDALLAGSFDLVFMDVNMPVMNGIEATKLYRFAALGRERVPIVALTADATQEARERCIEAGMDACLPKPIEPAELFRVIDRLTAGAADRKEAKPAAASVVTDIAAHPRFRGDVRSAIDSATIAELEALGGRSFVRELAEQFVEEGGRIMSDLGSAVAKNDVHYFRDRLHALRSGAANVGARGLYDLCMALRTTSSAEFAANGVAKVNEIEAEFERVEINLRDYREQKEAVAATPAASVARLPRKTPG